MRVKIKIKAVIIGEKYIEDIISIEKDDYKYVDGISREYLMRSYPNKFNKITDIQSEVIENGSKK